MLAVEQLERRRLLLQQSQDRARSAQQRNCLGQFATPGALADEILQHARQLLGGKLGPGPGPGPVRFLDPAIGTGSFYAALLRAWPIGQIGAGAAAGTIQPADLQSAVCVALEELQPQAKWSCYPTSLRVARRGGAARDVALREVAATTLGVD